MRYLELLASKLPAAEFYRTAFPTSAIKRTVAGLFSGLMGFLDEALVYHRSRRLSALAQIH